MKYFKIALALILTVIMLYVARTNSRGRPEIVSHVEAGYTFQMTTVPKIVEHQSDRITLAVTGPAAPGTRVWFRTSQPADVPADNADAFARVQMQPDPGSRGEYFTEVTAGRLGGRFYYYFELTDSTGSRLATFTVEGGAPFVLKYFGEVPKVVTLAHIATIFATVFFIALAAVSALSVLRGSGEVRLLTIHLFLAAVFAFLGGYVFGIPMNYFAFDVLWEGVPFGTDATDNKTQLLFVYLLFAVLSSLGTLTRGKLGRDIYSGKALGWVGLGAFAVMLFIYLIPHSIQFSSTLTYAFCYSWIGVTALLYVVGYLRSGRIAGRMA
ncbi:MAG TPA: hypothetical protein VMY05_07220 [Acidobacteriota bacterium]|nr:hypothetical protein [Acidobacteriota bacterium]